SPSFDRHQRSARKARRISKRGRRVRPDSTTVADPEPWPQASAEFARGGSLYHRSVHSLPPSGTYPALRDRLEAFHPPESSQPADEKKVSAAVFAEAWASSWSQGPNEGADRCRCG